MNTKIHWITDRAQAEALVDAARNEILDRLTALGPLGARDLAQALGRKPTAIYRHLKVLTDVGLVRAVEPAAAAERGRPSTAYRAVAPRVRLAKAAADPALKDVMGAIAGTLSAQAARTYAAALGAPETRLRGAQRNHGMFRVVSAPSPERLARINALLDEVLELAWTPDPNPGPLVGISWFLSPLGRSGRVKR